MHYSITTADGSRAFDLEGESSSANTRVGLWSYNDTPDAPVHRQWSLIELPAENNNNSGVYAPSLAVSGGSKSMSAACKTPGYLTVKSPGMQGELMRIYNAKGACVYSAVAQAESVTLSVPSGYYVVTLGSSSLPVVVR